MAYSLATSHSGGSRVGAVEAGDQLADLGVQFRHRLLGRFAVGARFLSRVVQVRQVDVEEIRPVRAGQRRLPTSTIHARRLDAGERAPKVVQRKMAQFGLQLVIQRVGPREAPGRFAAVGIVHRRGRADVVCAAALAVQRKPHGRRDRPVAVVEHVPNLRPQDAIVPGGPHFDALLIAPVKSVGDDAVLAGRLAGRHVGLHRARDRGKTGHQRRVAAAGRQAGQVGHRRQVALAEPGNLKAGRHFEASAAFVARSSQQFSGIGVRRLSGVRSA